MSSLECETSIDSLPEEVLCMIFDQLNLRDVKNASLTCRRWNDVIFLSPYVKRFRFKILLQTSWKPMEQRLMYFGRRMKNVVDYVNHTKRCYRHLRLRMDNIVPDDLQSVWECLHPKVTESIYSLKLYLEDISPNSVPLLAETIPVMPKLRSLIFSIRSLRYPHQITTVLRSSSVHHLEVGETDNFRIDMPELKSFVGPLSALAQPDGTGQLLVLAKLKHVTLTKVKDKIGNYSSIVPCRFMNVETLAVTAEVEAELFTAICNTCTRLKELIFKKTLLNTDSAAIKHICKLSNLRQLKFPPIFMNSTTSCAFNRDFDISQLTKLENLDLGYIDADCLIRLPQSITHLSVSINHTNEENIIESIIRALPELQKLHFMNYTHKGLYFQKKFIVTRNTLQPLYLLEKLEVLEFYNLEISESAFHGVANLMHQLSMLQFENCKLNRIRLQRLAERYSNLKINAIVTNRDGLSIKRKYQSRKN